MLNDSEIQKLSSILNGGDRAQFTLEDYMRTIVDSYLKSDSNISTVAENLSSNSELWSRYYNSMNHIKYGSPWSFTKGFILGQFSVILIMVFVIKYFFFTEYPSENETSHPLSASSMNLKTRIETSTATGSQFLSTILKRDTSGNSETGLPSEDKEFERSRQINNILEKTYYDVETHEPESLDWFNVLIAQAIQQFREEAWTKNNILNSLNDFIGKNSFNAPNYIDTINITELDIGEKFPIFSNCKIKYEKKKLEAIIDIELNDRIALGVDTRLLINFPKPATAVLPISLTVAVVKFCSRLTVSLTKANEFVHTNNSNGTSENDEETEEDDNGYFLIFSFSPEYELKFDTKSLIGAKSKIENIPKIATLIEHQINKWFLERCVEPRFQFIKLPSIWPRSRNTREEKPSTSDEEPSLPHI
ncbi:hypothetical protein KAFR_0C06400 [Kazachstania africana CBS 2517]|uniref:Maintenance of mitochondrial morphology protein 1 n=1 Tax=Kazachstania africana (strain ATCC 22294 / BCRC 22015 / CBS 2517 / CECT 1963 / NBRC 1671 / NRRL Y-8276) TaxID=1071382 RepID=H2ATD6_KAZAF|nr:hypothetical protein KAFR_0C06400 [Kazachstania africana CBS 2517]CCF57636.1 hypothetical protein KAFR_0C06400 [Kazachstania africana CBS 2517]